MDMNVPIVSIPEMQMISPDVVVLLENILVDSIVMIVNSHVNNVLTTP
jgi:hypothetical protein